MLSIPSKEILLARLVGFTALAGVGFGVLLFAYHYLFLSGAGPGSVLFDAVSWMGDKHDALRNAGRGLAVCVAALLAGFLVRFYGARAVCAYHQLAHPESLSRTDESALVHKGMVVLWMLIIALLLLAA